MKMVLADGAPRKTKDAVVAIVRKANTIEIGLEGASAPVVIEHYNGVVRLHVYYADGTECGCCDLTAESIVAPPAATPIDAVTAETPTPAAEVAPKGHLSGIRTDAPAADVAQVTHSEPDVPTDDELAAFDLS